jgi:hypothetical protein
MKTAMAIVISLFLPFICGEAAAQFSQPPPKRTAPACDLRKSSPLGAPISSDCKKTPVIAADMSLQCGSSSSSVYCTTSTWVLVGGQWIEIDRSSAIHDWAYIVDGREYYLNPMYQGSISVDCGNSRRGYVRAAVAGDSAVYAFACPVPTQQDW